MCELPIYDYEQSNMLMVIAQLHCSSFCSIAIIYTNHVKFLHSTKYIFNTDQFELFQRKALYKYLLLC